MKRIQSSSPAPRGGSTPKGGWGRGRDAHKERANTLIGMLVVVAIIAIMAAVFIGGGQGSALGVGESKRADGKGRTVLGAAKAAAQDDVCRSNLSQVRASLQIATATADEAPPQSLSELPNVASVSKCGVGKEPFVYDPATATVKCPHPGHGKY